MGGARALGRGDELGAVEKGRIADLVAYRLDSIAFAPANDLAQQLVYAASRREVDAVIVDEDIIEKDGCLTQVDESKLIAEIQEAHARIEPQITRSERGVEELLAPHERIYHRYHEIEIAHDTYPARFSH